jgi:hypothetical protein
MEIGLSINTQESRVNVLLRLVGLIFFAFGVSLGYLTYVESSQGNIVPQIVPVFYLISVMLIISGLMATIVKYK